MSNLCMPGMLCNYPGVGSNFQFLQEVVEVRD